MRNNVLRNQICFQESKMQGLMLWTKSKQMNCVKTNQPFVQKIMLEKWPMGINWP